MRVLLFAFSGLFLFSSAAFSLQAQTNSAAKIAPATNVVVKPAAPLDARENRMLSFLSPADRDKFATLHAKTLADHPDLQAQEAELKTETKALRGEDMSPEVKMALVEKFLTYQQNLRQAMLAEDPTIAPVLAEIDNHVSQAKAKRLGDVQNATSPTNVPSTNSPVAH